jgi:nitrogen fixation/metabolism regulation signal transduction histidine kinase
MESHALKKLVTGAAPVVALALLLASALFMMNAATQNSATFGRVYSLLLVINVLGSGILLVLILFNVRHLVHQVRERVPGSRLTLRLLLMFITLSVVPVVVVFAFSVHTINRGIDNWFDVKIEKALDDALSLGRASLDALKQDQLKAAQTMARELETIPVEKKFGVSTSLLSALNGLRDQYNVNDLTLFSDDGKILAASSDAGLSSTTLVPARPSETILSQVRQGLPYANVDAQDRGVLRLRIVVPVLGREVRTPRRYLQVLQPLPARYAKLGESVQSAFAEYEKLVYLRGPLKFSFTITLALVALLTTLLAVWAAMASARRLVAPIRDLAEGTKAVARGEYHRHLPVTSHDEMGVLVQSFNVMTRRVQRAQNQIKRSQQEAEIQRAYLATVLGHLSSGVLSFDARGRLRTHNAAAAQILNVDFNAAEGKTVHWLIEHHAGLAPFADTLSQAADKSDSEWSAEVILEGATGARTLMLRGTRLPGLRGKTSGYAVVFDDVTRLIQAQRDAAWGDVARRMAHEIKNPLTPIQLSAERIRHKYLKLLPEDEKDTLDRGTRTIVDQVESLKSMVNAFSDYAKIAQLKFEDLSLNELVRDVAELYRAEIPPLPAAGFWLKPADAQAGKPIRLNLELAEALSAVRADPKRLRQVLHNLLLNARDALLGASDPALTLRTRQFTRGERTLVEVTVADNGPGFPEHMLARLFDPYVTTKEKGTGLGLAIVKRIVEEHDGEIVAENLKEGGASLTLRLPATVASPTTITIPLKESNA